VKKITADIMTRGTTLTKLNDLIVKLGKKMEKKGK
jgi:hypothetical protein